MKIPLTTSISSLGLEFDACLCKNAPCQGYWSTLDAGCMCIWRTRQSCNDTGPTGPPNSSGRCIVLSSPQRNNVTLRGSNSPCDGNTAAFMHIRGRLCMPSSPSSPTPGHINLISFPLLIAISSVCIARLSCFR